MTSREDVRVKQLKLTSKQMRDAIKRATENVKHWQIWVDPKAVKK